MYCYNRLRVVQPKKDKKGLNTRRDDKKTINYMKIIDLCAQEIDDCYFSSYFRLRRKGKVKKLTKSYYEDPVRMELNNMTNCFGGIKKFSKKLIRPLVQAYYEREKRNFVFEKKKFNSEFSGNTVERRKNNELRMESVDRAIFKLLY